MNIRNWAVPLNRLAVGLSLLFAVYTLIFGPATVNGESHPAHLFEATMTYQWMVLVVLGLVASISAVNLKLFKSLGMPALILSMLPISAAAASPTISLADAAALDLTKASIVDVRYAGDYRRGHIKGAVSVPYYRLDKINLPKDRPIVTYCSGIGCALSMDAAAKLKDMGYTDVRYLLGGIAEWELKGYPIVRDEMPVKPQGPGIFEGGEISPPKVSKNLSRLMVLDTRPETEFLSGHVPGARNIPLERLMEGMGEITGEVIVCDRQPARWKRAALLLKEAGYDAHALSGGIGAWVGAKLPLETGADAK